jgi:glycerol-3-phosphate dehydrogenase
VVAEEAVDMVEEALGRAHVAATTAERPLPGGDIGDLDTEIVRAGAAIGDRTVARHLVHAHGSMWPEVWSRAERDPDLSRPVVPGAPYLRAEIVHALEGECALTLGDLLIRRTHLAFETTDHGRHAAETVAPLAARHLGWREGAMKREFERFSREREAMFGSDR